MKSLLLSLVLLFLFTGCASSKWESSATVGSMNSQGILNATVPSNSSYIYVYREDEFRGSATAWHLGLDGKPIGKLKNGSYLLIKTNPGKKQLTPESHVISLEDKPFEFNAEGGKAYFFRHGNADIFSSEVTFFPNPTEATRTKLASYSLVNIHEAYDPSFNPEVYATQQMCQNDSSNPKCMVSIEDVVGKVLINRANSGFVAKPGTVLKPNDVMITNKTSAAYIMLYGEPKMIRPQSSFTIKSLL